MDFLVITGYFKARVCNQTADFEDVIGNYAKVEKMSDNSPKLAHVFLVFCHREYGTTIIEM